MKKWIGVLLLFCASLCARDRQMLLYVSEACPCCYPVLTFIEENNLDIPTINIDGDKAARKTLYRNGGSSQVPCLFVNGRAYYENQKIIWWMKKNLLKEV